MKKEYIKPQTICVAFKIEKHLCQVSGSVEKDSMSKEDEEFMARDNIYGGRRQSIWDD